MKKYFVVSLIKNGILGGGIVADEKAVTYYTGKLTVPDACRHLVLPYADISRVSTERVLLLPTVSLCMRGGEEYRFAVFFGRKRFLHLLGEMGVDVCAG